MLIMIYPPRASGQHHVFVFERGDILVISGRRRRRGRSSPEPSPRVVAGHAVCEDVVPLTVSLEAVMRSSGKGSNYAFSGDIGLLFAFIICSPSCVPFHLLHLPFLLPPPRLLAPPPPLVGKKKMCKSNLQQTSGPGEVRRATKARIWRQ